MKESLQKVISGIGIRDIRLISINASTDMHDSGDGDREPISLDLLTYPPTIDVVGEERFLMGRVELKLSGRPEAEAASFDFAVSFLAIYEIFDSEITEKDCEFFAEHNIPLNIWPFIRETVHSLSGKMMFPRPLCLPLLRPKAVLVEDEQKPAPVGKKKKGKKTPAAGK